MQSIICEYYEKERGQNGIEEGRRWKNDEIEKGERILKISGDSEAAIFHPKNNFGIHCVHRRERTAEVHFLPMIQVLSPVHAGGFR